jgi:MFS family permease
MVFLIGAVATFPLCVPPFFLPLYAQSLGYSPYTGAAMVAGFNGASAVGRILTGFTSDKVGALNSLFGTLLLSALSMLCLWPVSSSLLPLIVFVVLNGMGNGGFFCECSLPIRVRTEARTEGLGLVSDAFVSHSGSVFLANPVLHFMITSRSKLT